MKENVILMGIANSFSAGVFISLGLTHLLKEANETFQEEYGDEAFPYAYFLCGCR